MGRINVGKGQKRSKETSHSWLWPILLIPILTSIGCSSFILKRDESKEIRLIKEVYEIIRERYYKEEDPVELAHKAINGMISGLDIYSSFVESESFKRDQTARSGTYGWTGIRVGQRDGKIKVISVEEGSPAEIAGIKVGDIVISVDGRKTYGIRETLSMLEGPPGTTVRIDLEREDGSRKEVVLRRKEREIRTVWYRVIEGNIGYIRISRFNTKTTSRQFMEALETLLSSGCVGLIIDLRQNHGGYLDQALQVVDPFLEGGKEIVRIISRYKPYNRSFLASRKRNVVGLRTVILVDGGTASVSEIVAAALRTWDKGIIVGTKTFGKGYIQDIIPLSDGSGLKLTVGRYIKPNGEEIEKVGIKPDIEIYLSPEQRSIILERFLNEIDLGNPDMDPQLSESIRILKER